MQGYNNTAMSGSDLDDWLNIPDCPQCGSEDVDCTDTYTDGLGRTVKVYLCHKCGHTWTEITA